MPQFHRILVPVDLSENSLSAIELASQLAKQYDAKLCFLYIEPPFFPREPVYPHDFQRKYVEEDRKQFESLRPTDPAVGYEHQISAGNAGPAIVKASEKADMCVMSTHGRSGFARLVMGSVAQYVLRHAKCPVILSRGFGEIQAASQMDSFKKQFVSEVMHHVSPVRATDQMDDVLRQLRQSGESGVPVVDETNHCIGILTMTDIERYQSLLARHQAHDETVIEEMFEKSKYGTIRCGNHDFDQVKRHMTVGAKTLQVSDSIETAISKFESNTDINHLVVLNDEQRPVGIVNSGHIIPFLGIEFLDSEDSESNSEEATAQSPSN